MLWQNILRANFRSWKKLAAFLQLEEEAALYEPSFPLNVPVRLAKKMLKGSLDDPILRQFVALKEEEVVSCGFCADPVEDLAFQKGGRLLHKYPGRALLVTTGACAMHCRYCFRKNYPYGGDVHSFDEELALLEPSIHEIILSGGDPLSLSNRSLRSLVEKLSSIAHLKRLRIHTRFVVGIPERIDEELIQIFQQSRLQTYFVIHINHPLELDEEVAASVKKLGLPLLNQSVLLKGVNDDVETFCQLLETLIDHGILPYYLHQLDPVQGAAHFFVPKEKGLMLIEEARKRLSGFAIPRYVEEIPHEKSKSLIRPLAKPLFVPVRVPVPMPAPSRKTHLFVE